MTNPQPADTIILLKEIYHSNILEKPKECAWG